MLSHSQSDQLFEQALKWIPGGVNSPVRAFRAVGGQPFFASKARGSRVYDVDGNEYIDYVGSWGPMILGHAHPKVVEAAKAAIELGTSFGIPNAMEVEMARLLCEAVPSLGKVRMCNSGTEATMSACRLARGYTKRDKILKFEGCYHGHADHLLVKAGSGALTFGQPDSAGVPASFAEHTLLAPYNDRETVETMFRGYGKEIAAVIVEPVAGNAGLFIPDPGFLEFLRAITERHGALLIFDEVMTGFRLAFGGAQERFGITPDLSCFGKIVGGGFPVGAFGGRAGIMDLLAPAGPVYQAGTLSGNPVAMAAGLAALKELKHGRVYAQLEVLGAQLEAGLVEAARSANKNVQVQRCGSMFCAYFNAAPVRNLEDAMKSDRESFSKFFRMMLEDGVYLAPSQFEAGFISVAHTQADIEKTVSMAARALAKL